jgi:DnaJ family protein C protein 19
MARLLVLLVLAVIVWKMVMGRWPWEKKVSTREQALIKARRVLAVEAYASREEILAAHRRLVAMVHPDRGGTNVQVHEANDARDLLLAQLPDPTPNPPQEPS